MSLIMEALKKAQHLRSKESKRTPLFRSSPPQKRTERTGFARRWIIIGSVFACLGAAIFIFLRPTSQSITLEPIRTTARIAKKSSLPALEKKTQENANELVAPEPMERPKETLNQPEEKRSPESMETPKGIPSLSKGQREDKAAPEPKPVVKQKIQEPPRTAVSAPHAGNQAAKPVKQMKSPEKVLAKKEPPSTRAVSPKEEVLSKASGASEQREEKNRVITSEAIHQFDLAVSLRNNTKAIPVYQKAIELDPAYIEAYNNLGIAYQELGDFDRAIETYQKAIEINPQYAKAHNNLGTLLLLKGRLGEAVEAFEKALALDPNNVESLINLGVIFKKQGLFEQGIDAYQKALSLNPLRGETHYNIAILYEKIENFESAEDHYRKFLQYSSNLYPSLASRVQNRLSELSKNKSSKGSSGQGMETGK